MTNRCAKCGKFMDPLDVSKAWCPRCFQAELDKPWSEVLAERVLDVWCGPRRTEQENWWQDVPEPETPKREWRGHHHTAIFMDEFAAIEPNQQEDEMKDVKAGQTWEATDQDTRKVIAMTSGGYPVTERIRFARDNPRTDVHVWVGEKAGGGIFHKLLKDEHGNPVEQEPEVPEEVETEVRVGTDGAVGMRAPVENDEWFLRACQGIGCRGWTCVGFRFKQSPEKIIAPSPVAWADTLGVLNQFGASAKYKPVIAARAVWRKLGS